MLAERRVAQDCLRRFGDVVPCSHLENAPRYEQHIFPAIFGVQADRRMDIPEESTVLPVSAEVSMHGAPPCCSNRKILDRVVDLRKRSPMDRLGPGSAAWETANL